MGYFEYVVLKCIKKETLGFSCSASRATFPKPLCELEMVVVVVGRKLVIRQNPRGRFWGIRHLCCGTIGSIKFVPCTSMIFLQQQQQQAA